MPGDSRPEAFLRAILRQLRADAALVELVDAPPDHYTLRIGLPDDVSKTIILTRDLVERAQASAVAFRSLRLVLKAELVQQRARRAVHQARTARSEARAQRVCPECRDAIAGSDLVVVRKARFLHRRCDPLNRQSRWPGDPRPGDP
jgi:hypothetical protein